MGTWVEVNDEGAAIAAGNRFSALASDVTTSEPPSDGSIFGDDKFGDRMRESYPYDTEKNIVEAKTEIRDHLTNSGDAVQWAVSETTGQDREEGAVFTNITPPEV